jgi:hypothetical protein
MRQTLLNYLTIGRNVMLAPRQFFQRMSITEGIRQALFFVMLVYYIRCTLYFIMSYNRGYFFNPAIVVNKVTTPWAVIFLALTPFLLLLILYSQAIFVNRIGSFFGGMANFEGAFKILGFTLFISLFMLIPFVGAAAHIWASIVLIIGVRYVFNVDWISSILTLFFSYIFTAALYIIVFGIPALASKMVFLRL